MSYWYEPLPVEVGVSTQSLKAVASYCSIKRWNQALSTRLSTCSTPPPAAQGAAVQQGLPAIARHVKGCRFIQETMVQNACR